MAHPQRALLVLLLIASALVVPSMAAAQAGTDSAGEIEVDVTPDLFSWYPDTGLGVVFGIAAGAGALFTTFFLVGGVVPGIAGRARIDADQARLEKLEARLAELAGASPVDAPAVEAVRKATNDLRDDVRHDRWALFGVAGTLYVVLGVFFGLLLAHDVLQALLVGAGWTSVAGTVGLKDDYGERKELKDQVIDDLIASPTTPGGASGTPLPAALEADVHVAKAV